MELSLSLTEGIDKRTVNVSFLMVSCDRIYNYFLEKAFFITLNIVTSTIHMNMKYHNDIDESVTTQVDILEDH